jgi:hypothetical protein
LKQVKLNRRVFFPGIEELGVFFILSVSHWVNRWICFKVFLSWMGEQRLVHCSPLAPVLEEFELLSSARSSLQLVHTRPRAELRVVLLAILTIHRGLLDEGNFLSVLDCLPLDLIIANGSLVEGFGVLVLILFGLIAWVHGRSPDFN